MTFAAHGHDAAESYTGFSRYPSGKPVHAMLTFDPSHAQPATNALHTT
jgi:hypothetical protein